MKKLLALMIAIVMVLGLAGFVVALETHHPAKKDNDGRIAKPGKSIGTMYVNDWVSEGDTSDAWETTIGVTDPSADRAIDFPNASGTVALTEDIGTSMALSDAKVLMGASTGLAVEKTLTLTGDVTATFLNSGNAVASLEAGTDAQLMVYNAGDGWGPDTMSGDVTIDNDLVSTIGNNKIGTAEFNVNTITIDFWPSQTSNTASVTAGSTILGVYAFANVDAEVANIAAISSTTLTLTLVSAAANDISLFKVVVLEP